MRETRKKRLKRIHSREDKERGRKWEEKKISWRRQNCRPKKPCQRVRSSGNPAQIAKQHGRPTRARADPRRPVHVACFILPASRPFESCQRSAVPIFTTKGCSPTKGSRMVDENTGRKPNICGPSLKLLRGCSNSSSGNHGNAYSSDTVTAVFF